MIKGISSSDARQATECTKCGAAFGSADDYVGWATEEQGQAVADYVQAAGKIITKRTFRQVPVHEASNPSHAHCIKCSDSYRKRLERRAAGKAQGEQAKARKANLYGADCMCVATSLATGLRYDRMHNLMKRLSTQYNGRTNGPKGYECPRIVQVAAEKRGMQVESLAVYGQSPAEITKQYGKQGNLIMVASKNKQGHAMAAVKGTLHNAHQGWDTRSECYFAFLVTKA